MPRSRAVLARCTPVLLALVFGACRDDQATTSPDQGSASASSTGAPAGKPAPKGSFADLATRFDQANRQPGGAGKAEATGLTEPLLTAASSRLTELSILHEVNRGDGVAALTIQADSGSPLGRQAQQVRSAGDTRMVYDLVYFREHPDDRVGYDAQTNVLRIPHAVLLRGGDPDEPTLRHEQARAEAWGPFRRGEPSPYQARLVDDRDAAHPHLADELHADARDLVRELQAVSDLLISPDDAPVTQADLTALLKARESGAPLGRPLTDFEARWDRLAGAALHGAAEAALFDRELRQAQTLAKGKAGATFSPGPRGATALLQLAPPKNDPERPSYALFVDLAQSTGPDDAKNPALLKTQLADTLEAVELHGPHFAAVVEVLRRVAATPSGAERRALLKHLQLIITPEPIDAPAKARTQAAYIKRFDDALAGKPPAKK